MLATLNLNQLATGVSVTLGKAGDGGGAAPGGGSGRGGRRGANQ
jgi:hypothetical protein